MQDEKIYLDFNATTPLLPEIEEKMQNNLPKIPLNPSSAHAFGQIARNILEEARHNILRSVFNSENHDYDLIFTSSGTESNNTIVKSFEGSQICCSAVEHPSILKLYETGLCEIVKITKDGDIDLNNLEKVLKNGNIKLVSIMHANNETGAIHNIDEISKITKKYGTFFHTDASQSFSKIKCDFISSNPDFITISSHKIYGPIGVSALIFKKNAPIKKLLFGGSQEFEKRAGTENIPAIYGFSLAAEMVDLFVQKYEKIRHLRDKIDEATITKGYEIACKKIDRIPNTTMILKPNSNTSLELMRFDLNGIMASGGSACSWGLQKSSKIPKILDFDKKFHDCTLRFSLGIDTKESEIDKLISLL